ncbi:hypothetical protein CPB83DRAFT_908575 [Crepidotus variabilis]|uniref:Uncharacterized protein n=1 Tax=Crepidotus variabilis TaxID=179855 RepID=A0A9P6JMU6_9AGAR|nr:hypothetical protein CPB83DRAFT_908575 [Crepidotus variabilis]
MSSSIPTSLPNPALATPRTEEPADQWASSTLSALDPNTTTDSYVSGPHVSKETQHFTTGTASTATTPGVNMPGGFPGSKSGPGIVQPDMEQMKGAALNAYETVQGYAVSAAATASTAAQSAGETVGQYLPESMKGYLPGTTAEVNPNRTLPSEELTQNAHPSTRGGVGTLPGPPGEADVAVLPHERTGGVSTDKLVNESISGASLNKSSPISTTTNNNAAVTSSIPKNINPESTHTGFIPTSLAADSTTSIAKLPEESRHHNLPTHDDESSTVLGKSAGVGKLPGSADESGVALVPDERKATADDQSKLSAPSMASAGADTDASVKTLAGSRMGGQPQAPPSLTTGLDSESNTSGRAPGGVGAGSGAAIGGPQTQARQHPLSQDEKGAFEKNNKNFMTKDQVDTNVSSIGAPVATGASVPQATSSSADKLGHKDTPSTSTGAPAPGMLTNDSNVATPGHGDTPSTMKSSQDKEINKSAHSASPSSDSGSGPAKKTGFMSKVKGEMKVLSGKMSKDEAKIEEGRKLMGKN